MLNEHKLPKTCTTAYFSFYCRAPPATPSTDCFSHTFWAPSSLFSSHSNSFKSRWLLRKILIEALDLLGIQVMCMWKVCICLRGGVDTFTEGDSVGDHKYTVPAYSGNLWVKNYWRLKEFLTEVPYFSL